MLVTLTHPVANFTGVVTVAADDNEGILPFTNGTASIDLDPDLFGAVGAVGISITIGAQGPAPAYDANLDVSTAAIVTAPASSTAAALRAAYVPKVLTQTAENSPARVFAAQPITPGNEPFTADLNSFANQGAGAGTYNHSMHYGFNAGRHSGGSVVTGKPAVYMGFEDNYFDYAGDGAYGIEWYVGFISPDGTTVAVGDLRPFYTRVTDSTTNTAAKDVLTKLDITTRRLGAQGQLSVWGSVKSGTQLFALTRTQALFNVPLNVVGNVQVSPLSGTAQVLVKAITGQASQLAFQPNGLGNTSYRIVSDNQGEMYVFDDTNGRLMVNFLGGASSDAATLDVKATLKLNNTTSTSATAGGATALPATPQGYFQVKDSAGVVRKVPYYA